MPSAAYGLPERESWDFLRKISLFHRVFDYAREWTVDNLGPSGELATPSVTDQAPSSIIDHFIFRDREHFGCTNEAMSAASTVRHGEINDPDRSPSTF